MSDGTRFSLKYGMELAGVDLGELWWRYVAVGGTADAASLARCLSDDEQCSQHEHDLIAQALNEAFLDRGFDTFPVGYSAAARSVAASGVRLAPAPMPNALDARRQAAAARLRSVTAARRSAQLHATAARLMQASGQLQFARHARTRSQAALLRAGASAAA